MHLIMLVLFVLGAIAAVGGLLILVVLAPKPSRLEDHLLGLARYMMFAGAAFGAAAALNGWQPRWHETIFMLGFGLGMAIFARRNHLLALAAERLASEEQGTSA